MLYTKQTGVGGAFVDKKELVNGQKVKLVSECAPVERDYQGKVSTQHIAKMKIQGQEEVKNVALNTPTRNGLIDAFGEDSKGWINQVLTVYTEKTTIGGKRVIVLYLLPEGFEVAEDEGGYVVVQRVGEGKAVKQKEDVVEYPTEDISPEDIPF